MILRTLIRKQFRDTRWSLLLCTLAFLGLSFLTTWVTLRFERARAQGDTGRADRRMGILRGLGGPAQDFSTLAMEVCWWNHPIIILTITGWAIARGSAAVAGEIERGTLDVTLSRPVSRSMYLLSQVIVGVLGIAILAGALIAGSWIASRVFPVQAPPSLLGLLRPGMMLVALGVSIFGYTLPFSAGDAVRWRPGVLALGITLLGLIAMSMAPQFEGFDWLEKLSVFRAYAPVTVAVGGGRLAYNVGVLSIVFALGVLASWVIFARRDLPTGGG